MSNEFFRISRITGKKYNVFETVRIVNMTQAMSYIEHDALPVDITIGKNIETNKKNLVFYFLKNDTKDMYEQWCNYTLK